MKSEISKELIEEFCNRANEIYAVTGINLSILHQVAYRLEANAKEIEELRFRIEGLEK